MRIGIDIDGVCADWTREAKRTLNEEFGYKFDQNIENPTWDFIEEGVAPEHWDWLWNHGVERGLFLRLWTIPGAYVGVRHLCERHDVIFLTDRPRNARLHTVKWLTANFPFDWQGVVVHKGKEMTKCDIYVDDKPSNVTKLRSASPSSVVVLFSRDYNRNFEWSPRVETWEEFTDLVRKVETNEFHS